MSIKLKTEHARLPTRDPVLTNNQGVMEANTLEGQSSVWGIRVNSPLK